jgi:AmiR/NasT family two-component response regulator
MREDIGAAGEASIVARLEVVNQQLRGALDSRVVIEQAKGILSERFALSLDDAFDLLRDAARRSRIELSALSHAVVSSSSAATPEPILAALDRWQERRGLEVRLAD